MESKVCAIDIRYNLEYVGLKEGLGKFKMFKEKQIKELTVEQIKNKLSYNGCPPEINHYTNKDFKDKCDKLHHEVNRCVKCWLQEAE
jgi:nitrate reductase cytochrome c-type subunit